MTIAQKILAAHARGEYVEVDDLITVDINLVLGNEITSEVAIKEFNKLGREEVFNKDEVVLVPDHFTPSKDNKIC